MEQTLPVGLLYADAKSIRVLCVMWTKRGGFAISKQAHQINEDIKDKEVRLIGEDGEQLGVMSCQAAQEIADEKELDLVKISPGAKPPVCKVMDYGKFKFEQSKREKEAKRNQHVVEIKELRMSPVIDTNDFNTKVRSGCKFLNEGNRLKVTIRFRGRQMAHTEIGAKILEQFAACCTDCAVMEKNPKLEGRNMSMFLSPKAQKPEKAGKASKVDLDQPEPEEFDEDEELDLDLDPTDDDNDESDDE